LPSGVFWLLPEWAFSALDRHGSRCFALRPGFILSGVKVGANRLPTFLNFFPLWESTFFPSGPPTRSSSFFYPVTFFVGFLHFFWLPLPSYFFFSAGDDGSVRGARPPSSLGPAIPVMASIDIVLGMDVPLLLLL